MRLVKPSVEVIKQTVDYDIYRHIAYCYSYLYKINKPVTLDECRRLVDDTERFRDFNLLRHAAVYLILPLTEFFIIKYDDDKNCKIFECDVDQKLYVTTSYDFIVENNYFADLHYATPCNILHEKIITAIIKIDKLGVQSICNNLAPFFNITCGNSFDFRNNDPNRRREAKYIIPSYLDIQPGQYLQSKRDLVSTYVCPALGVNYRLCIDNLGVTEEMFQNFSVEEKAQHQACVKELNIIYSFLNRRHDNEKALNNLVGTELFTPQAHRNINKYFSEELVIVTGTEYNWTMFINKRLECLSGANTKTIFNQIREQI